MYIDYKGIHVKNIQQQALLVLMCRSVVEGICFINQITFRL